MEPNDDEGTWPAPGGGAAEPMLALHGSINAAAFSPGGALLAVGRMHAIELLDGVSGKRLRVLGGHTGDVESVAFGPDATWLASASSDGTVRIWDVAEGIQRTVLTDPDRNHLNVVVVSADGALLAVAPLYGRVRIWETATGTVRTVLPGPDQSLGAVAFSADGTRVAVAGGKGKIRVHDVAGGVLRHTLSRPRLSLWLSLSSRHDVCAVTFTAGDEWIAAVDGDGGLYTWNADDGRLATATSLADRRAGVDIATFSPDGSRVVTVPRHIPGPLTVSNVPDGTPGRQLGYYDSVRAIAYLADGTRIAAGSSDGSLDLLDLPGGGRRKVRGGIWHMWDAAFSPNGRLVATGANKGSVHIWDWATGDILATLPHEYPVWRVAFGADGRSLVTLSAGTVRVWDVATATVRRTLNGGYVRHLAFAPANASIATMGGGPIRMGGGPIRVWDAETAAERAHITADPSWTFGIALAATGALLATGGQQGLIVWTLAPVAQRRTLKAPEGDFSSNDLALSDDGTRVAAAVEAPGRRDSRLHVWSVADGTVVDSLPHPDKVTAIVFAPGATTVATGGADGVVRLWESGATSPSRVLTGHLSEVRSVAFSPDGSRLVTASDDGTARVWDIRTGMELALLVSLKSQRGFALFPDGSYHLTGDPGKNLWWVAGLERQPPAATT